MKSYLCKLAEIVAEYDLKHSKDSDLTLLGLGNELEDFKLSEADKTTLKKDVLFYGNNHLLVTTIFKSLIKPTQHSSTLSLKLMKAYFVFLVGGFEAEATNPTKWTMSRNSELGLTGADIVQISNALDILGYILLSEQWIKDTKSLSEEHQEIVKHWATAFELGHIVTLLQPAQSTIKKASTEFQNFIDKSLMAKVAEKHKVTKPLPCALTKPRRLSIDMPVMVPHLPPVKTIPIIDRKVKRVMAFDAEQMPPSKEGESETTADSILSDFLSNKSDNLKSAKQNVPIAEMEEVTVDIKPKPVKVYPKAGPQKPTKTFVASPARIIKPAHAVKSNVANLLRQNALIQSKLEESKFRLEEECILATAVRVHPDSDEAIRAKDRQAELEAQSKLKLAAQINRLTTKAVRKEVVLKNRKLVQSQKLEQERLDLEKARSDENKARENSIAVAQSQAIKEKIIEAKAAVTDAKNQKAVENRRESIRLNKEQELRRFQGQNEIVRKAQSLRAEMKQVPDIRRERLANVFDPTETTECGLISEMSHMELKERLYMTKKARRDDEKLKRSMASVQRKAKSQKMLEIQDRISQIALTKSHEKNVQTSPAVTSDKQSLVARQLEAMAVRVKWLQDNQ